MFCGQIKNFYLDYSFLPFLIWITKICSEQLIGKQSLLNVHHIKTFVLLAIERRGFCFSITKL